MMLKTLESGVSSFAPGAHIFLAGSGTLDRTLAALEATNGQPSLAPGIWPCHVAMCILTPDGSLQVAEMTYPVCRITPVETWVAAQAPDSVWCSTLKQPLTPTQQKQSWNWWAARQGMRYDVDDLLQLGALGAWASLCAKLHLPQSWSGEDPITVKGVCSVNVSWHDEIIGLGPVGDPERNSPARCIAFPFLNAPVRIT